MVINRKDIKLNIILCTFMVVSYYHLNLLIIYNNICYNCNKIVNLLRKKKKKIQILITNEQTFINIKKN
ncbi:hypothetical protein PFNF135_05734 [Plasmodium falciparum NF135/5.C10]|uniref:Uncharacterized protein n=2 Tax=Plasmodium falciparum TaxID=5833 RepID=A0A024UZB3_PLAFA|nr:hypothetical protein PFFVO_05177 [Plasmodium falciparum Vietnam Oak-Knoll (FVO)]ETW39705.1 hypothetical protein PFNF135_05734 [Plasmodium falciparum NF135/5.C10]